MDQKHLKFNENGYVLHYTIAHGQIWMKTIHVNA